MKKIIFKNAIFRFIFRNAIYFKVILALAIAYGVYYLSDQYNYSFSFPFLAAIFYVMVLWIWRIPHDITLSLTVFFLVVCVLALIKQDSDLADTAALSLYYFLIIAVIQSLFSGKSQKNRRLSKVVDNSYGRPKREMV